LLYYQLKRSENENECHDATCKCPKTLPTNDYARTCVSVFTRHRINASTSLAFQITLGLRTGFGLGHRLDGSFRPAAAVPHGCIYAMSCENQGDPWLITHWCKADFNVLNLYVVSIYAASCVVPVRDWLRIGMTTASDHIGLHRTTSD